MAKGKAIRLTDEELNQIVMDAVNKGIEAQRKEQKNMAERERQGLRYNTKILLENYMKFKKFISESVKSIEEVEGFGCDQNEKEIMRIFGLREDDRKLRSIQRSVAIMTLLMAHVDRMLEVYEASCKGSSSVVVQRRWEVIERMYLREKRMNATQIADEFHLEVRNIQEDAKRGREDLKVLLFGIESIIVDMAR